MKAFIIIMLACGVIDSINYSYEKAKIDDDSGKSAGLIYLAGYILALIFVCKL